MFRRIKLKLSIICCFTTSFIVLIIILCCLHVSEKNMFGQETAQFFLKTNTISSDLHLSESIDINWYMRNYNADKNILYLEVNGSPATLSTLILSDEEYSFICGVKEYIQTSRLTENTTFSPSYINQQYFEYTKDNRKFLVMNADLTENGQKITCIYLYGMDSFYRSVKKQRILFFAIWFISILILYLFSHIFTSHALKPVIQNDEKQKHFIAVASHELRSPLAVFKTGLSILKSNPDSEKTTRIFSLMDSEMSGMERLIQDLLCLTKAQNAKLSFYYEHVNLADLLSSIYEKYYETSKDKQLTLSLSIAADCNYDCYCDKKRIGQALVTLLDNALSYTPPGQNISLNLYSSHKNCYLQVIDTGTGISDSDKEKIFDRFYQVNSSHSHKNHFGLGLAIAKEICHTHGGKISVSDTKGGGSTFTITLPR